MACETDTCSHASPASSEERNHAETAVIVQWDDAYPLTGPCPAHGLLTGWRRRRSSDTTDETNMVFASYANAFYPAKLKDR